MKLLPGNLADKPLSPKYGSHLDMLVSDWKILLGQALLLAAERRQALEVSVDLNQNDLTYKATSEPQGSHAILQPCQHNDFKIPSSLTSLFNIFFFGLCFLFCCSLNGGTPKTPQVLIIFSRKTHGCWGNPPFLGNPHLVWYMWVSSGCPKPIAKAAASWTPVAVPSGNREVAFS